jgi:hypothetical protein
MDFSETSENYFQLTDYVADTGAIVSVGLTQDFVYDGAPSSAASDIPASNLKITARYVAGGGLSATCKSDWSTACQLMTASTSAQVTVTDFAYAGDYYEGTDFSSSAVVGTAPYITATTPYPYVLRFGLEKLTLTIPADAVNGSYESTLYVLATGA